MKKTFKALYLIFLAVFFQACSSSGTSDESEFEDIFEELPMVEADTGEVPDDSVEFVQELDESAADSEDYDGLSLEDDSSSPQEEQSLAEESTNTPAEDTGFDSFATSDDPFSFDEPAPAEPVAPVEPSVADSGFSEPSFSEPTFSDPAPVDSFQAESSGSGNVVTHQTVSGDTLMRLAYEYYGDVYQWRKIYDLNRDVLSSPNAVPRGVSLKIDSPTRDVASQPSGEKYVIQPGDTLGKISDKLYGTEAKWKKLWESNRELIKDPNKIYAGFYLYYTRTAEEMSNFSRVSEPVNSGFEERAPASTDQGSSPITPEEVPANSATTPVQ